MVTESFWKVCDRIDRDAKRTGTARLADIDYYCKVWGRQALLAARARKMEDINPQDAFRAARLNLNKQGVNEIPMSYTREHAIIKYIETGNRDWLESKA